MQKEKEWWAKGIQFECQGSGKCCVSRGEYGHVYLSPEDRRKLAKFFKIPMGTFTRKYCERGQGIWKLKDFSQACVFLDGTKCKVYSARPMQCRTWPFWPEVMNAKKWKKEVQAFCPGVGKGKVWSEKEIRDRIRKQTESEASWGK